MFAKIDLSDGFWRMSLVQESDKWNFAYALPSAPGKPFRLIIPYTLQMGWTGSPGYFFAATETGHDIMQALIDWGIRLPLNVLVDSYYTDSVEGVHRPKTEHGKCPPCMSTIASYRVCQHMQSKAPMAPPSSAQGGPHCTLFKVAYFPPPTAPAMLAGKTTHH